MIFISVSIGCSSDSSSPEPAAPEKVQSQSVVTCDQISTPGRPVLYCFQDTSGHGSSAEAKATVLYFFHGLGGNVNDIFGSTGREILNALAFVLGRDMPIVVSISLGSAGVMSAEAGNIIDLALPPIETRVAPEKVVRRIVMGASMGGHNALRLVAEAPDRFVAAIALCPAIGTFNGHDSTQVESYIARNQTVLDRKFFEQALAVYRNELPTLTAWDANNPFALLAKGRYDSLPMFISVGRQDSLAFFEGAREFKRISELRPGMSVDYREVDGTHCAFDVSALIRYLKAKIQSTAPLKNGLAQSRVAA